MATSNQTKDHATIKRWVEDRGGKPAAVRQTQSDEGAGILRVDFPGYSGEETLQPISWEEFFETFDERGLSFLYQDETTGGEMSRFCKFIRE
ncbi:MAG: hypothetical protein KDD69_07250 [Bdellovibrionales bacterium]|nr:hypothetical protein [Bdellovibrionales bacterium]